MNKNEWWIPGLILLLSAVFAGISLAVYLSRGKSAFWVSKKMRVGGLLLSLTAITNLGCDQATISCYDPMPENYFELDNSGYNNEINLNLNDSNTVTGRIYGRIDTVYSFNISDSLNQNILQKGNIAASDGSFDTSTEEFRISINPELQTAHYQLNLFSSDQNNQQNPNGIFYLNLQNED